MEKEVIDKILQMFREAEDKDKTAKMLLTMLDFFEPELYTKEKYDA